jgi:hypothetical protein
MLTTKTKSDLLQFFSAVDRLKKALDSGAEPKLAWRMQEIKYLCDQVSGDRYIDRMNLIQRNSSRWPSEEAIRR